MKEIVVIFQLNQQTWTFLNIAKILQTCYFRYFGMPGHTHQISKYHTVWKFDAYLHAKKQLQLSLISWDVANKFQTYFGYSRHEWLWAPKTMVSVFRKLCRLHSCKKFISYLSWNTAIANLLFWALWTCLATLTKSYSINF